MHKPIIFLLLFWMTTIAQGTPLPEKTKKELIDSGVQSCLVEQRNDPLAKYFTESQRYEYCYCSMSKAADLLTLEEFGKFLQTKDKRYIFPAMKKAETYCSQTLAKKWGYR